MKITVAGGGIGGLTAAICLHQRGHDVEIIEQARAFGEVGAGVQVSPNAARVLGSLGLGDDLDRVGIAPERIRFRRWEDDRLLLDNPMGDAAVERYGFRSYNVYRPDLIAILADAASDIPVRFGARVVGASADGACELDDGERIEADLLIGADGVHSAVRHQIFGPETTRFSGYVAYRALVPAAAVPEQPPVVTIRMGPDRHLVTYFVGEGKRFLNIVGIVPEAEWDVESWNEPGDLADLQAEFADWNPAVADILAKVDRPVFRWALHDREPLEAWTNDRVALLGDSCHPMLPFMGQGACQAIEDAVVLANHLDRTDDRAAALGAYEAVRKPRASRIQDGSWTNRVTYHLPDGPEQEARDEIYAAASPEQGLGVFDWLYGHDALED